MVESFHLPSTKKVTNSAFLPLKNLHVKKMFAYLEQTSIALLSIKKDVFLDVDQTIMVN